MPLLDEVAAALDAELRTGEIPDWPGAHNGLQVPNAAGRVTRFAAAVDANPTTVARAAAHGAALLLVHHGLVWNRARPQRGAAGEMWRRMISAGVGVYAAHLPLDVHPALGNNALLARALGLENPEPFLLTKGVPVGLKAPLALPREELIRRLESATGGATVRACPGGPAVSRVVGVVTGGAGGELREAAAAGVDTFVTGEGPHWTFGLAEELGVNVLYGGHYATETFGVRALAEWASARWGLPWEWIDHPSGL